MCFTLFKYIQLLVFLIPEKEFIVSSVFIMWFSYLNMVFLSALQKYFTGIHTMIDDSSLIIALPLVLYCLWLPTSSKALHNFNPIWSPCLLVLLAYIHSKLQPNWMACRFLNCTNTTSTIPLREGVIFVSAGREGTLQGEQEHLRLVSISHAHALQGCDE